MTPSYGKRRAKKEEKGWLTGPIPLQRTGRLCLIISRTISAFGKNRSIGCIDDYSASLVNSTCQVGESPLLHTIDVSAALAGRSG